MKMLLKQLFKFFLQGLVILGPFAVTLYCVYFVFENVDSIIPDYMKLFPGLGVIIVLCLIALIGYLGEKFFLTRWLLDLFDSLIEKIPGVKFIYTSTKEVIGSFVGDKKKFNNPVWVRVNDQPAMWRIGFLTRNALSYKNMEGRVAVYLPHSYAISGWVIIIDAACVIPITDISAADAMKFAVSGGVTGQDEPPHPPA